MPQSSLGRMLQEVPPLGELDWSRKLDHVAWRWVGAEIRRDDARAFRTFFKILRS